MIGRRFGNLEQLPAGSVIVRINHHFRSHHQKLIDTTEHEHCPSHRLLAHALSCTDPRIPGPSDPCCPRSAV